MINKTLSINEIGLLAAELGIDIVGACDLDQLKAEIPRIGSWQQAGHAGEMQYMKRPAELFTGASHILAEAKSVLSCTISYSSQAHPLLKPGFGRVARYAWGSDYHLILPEILKQLVTLVEKKLGTTVKSRVMTDALPFLERAGARLAGLGFVGKNTMLIRKGIGSFFFIAEIFWDVDLEIGEAQPEENGCGTCTRCLESCPTNAFVADYQLNASRCISYLTIEKRGIHSEEERTALGEWVFGCDICQDVCPFNHAAIKHASLKVIDGFRPHTGNGALIDLGEILRIKSNKEFERRFKNTPLLRPGKIGLQRNALAVAVNTSASHLRDEISELARHSTNDVIRETAKWAEIRLA